MSWLFSFFFGCFHKRTTFPITIKKRTYVACLTCGKELPYSWRTMRLGEEEVILTDAQEETV